MRKQMKAAESKRLQDSRNKSSTVHMTTAQTGGSAMRSTPNPWAWVAVAWIDALGRCARSEGNGALPVFATSVHERYPTTLRERFRLLEAVASQLRGFVPEGSPSLWVFPGGFLGFNADKRRWRGLGDPELSEIATQSAATLTEFPAGARIVFGVDADDGKTQQGWIIHLDTRGRLHKTVIQREMTALSGRKVEIGQLRAAFFICGEFTGSRTDQNGPYYRNHYLENPARDLSDCQLLVDLAHRRVRHTIDSRANCPPRYVHQLQMERFSSRGAAILTHHHGGERIDGDNHQRTDCWSNWIMFKGGRWSEEAAVEPICAP